ncbi:hypothetical protein HN615_11230 [Candidatus Woesearchaeota archaeon]|jgi:hypothetical protein|nr:hypothetical protein [Candidatus Woesearchaeota archaeon]
MAYYSQERKKSVAPLVRDLLKEYGFKGSLSVDNHSSVILTLKEGNMDVIGNYNEVMKDRPRNHIFEQAHSRDRELDVNVYWYKEDFSGRVLEFLTKVIRVLNVGNHNRSEPMVDYFDVGWYVHVRFGRWNTPYVIN